MPTTAEDAALRLQALYKGSKTRDGLVLEARREFEEAVASIHKEDAVRVSWPLPRTLCKPTVLDIHTQPKTPKGRLPLALPEVGETEQHVTPLAQTPLQTEQVIKERDAIPQREQSESPQLIQPKPLCADDVETSEGLLRELASIRESMRINREKVKRTLRAIEERQREKKAALV